MFTDFVMNGQGHGLVGETLAGCRWDKGFLQPYFSPEDGEPCVTHNTGNTIYDKEKKNWKLEKIESPIRALRNRGLDSPVWNATTLRKDEWLQMDRVVVRAARQRLRAWADLAAANSFGGFDAMSKMVLEHEAMSDPGEAVVDMDGLAEGRNDTPQFKLGGIPLPITHSDFWFSKRRLAVSRNSGTPLDSTMGEAAGRRVAEMVEKTLIGTVTGITYGNDANRGYDLPVGSPGNPTVYGYTNFPDRVTKTNMTAPDGTNGTTILTEWLQLREDMYSQNFFGPFMAYVSTNYDQFLDDEFKTNSDKSLRSRLLEIDGITGIRRLDFLTASTTTQQVIFVQMTPDVARAINGMDITTVQWEELGGMKLHFKVMAIMVPQLRSDYNGNAGIGHGTTS